MPLPANEKERYYARSVVSCRRMAPCIAQFSLNSAVNAEKSVALGQALGNSPHQGQNGIALG